MKRSTALVLGGAAAVLILSKRASGTMGDVKIPSDADLSPDFRAGLPGTYEIGVTCRRVNLNESQLERLDPETWTRLFRQRGVNAKVVKLRTAGTTNAVYRNSAYGLVKDYTGWDPGTGSNDVLADVSLVFTVEIGPQSRQGYAAAGQPYIPFRLSGMGDLGVAPLVAGGIALLVVGILGAGLALYDAFADTDYAVTWAKKIANFVGGVVGGSVSQGVVKPLTETSFGVVIPILLGVGALVWIASKSKLRAGPVSAG